MKEICAKEIIKEEWINDENEHFCLICTGSAPTRIADQKYWYHHLEKVHYITENNDSALMVDCEYVHVYQRQRVLR